MPAFALSFRYVGPDKTVHESKTYVVLSCTMAGAIQRLRIAFNRACATIDAWRGCCGLRGCQEVKLGPDTYEPDEIDRILSKTPAYRT